MRGEPIVIQEIMVDKNDFPQPGEYFQYKDDLYKVICSRISVKVKNMYFVNIWLEDNYEEAISNSVAVR